MNFAVNRPAVNPTIARIIKQLLEAHSRDDERQPQKIRTIKSIRTIWPALGLKEAKELYDWAIEGVTPCDKVLHYLMTVEA